MIEKYVNREELNRLLSTLVVVVGALTIAALFATILVPGLRNANKPSAPAPVNPVVGEPGWLDPAEYPAEKGKIAPPSDPMALISSSAELIARGKDLFAQNCSPCHGDRGLGNGPAAAGLNPPPRDFSGSSGWKNGSDLAGIFKTLSEGIQGSAMSAFDYLQKRDRMALAHFVQSLGTFSHPPLGASTTAELVKILSSAGESTSNRIPVSQAMIRLAQEYVEPAPVAAGPEEPGAEVVRKAVADPARAARSLASSTIWRSSPKDLAAMATAGAPANGFSVHAAFLDDAEWQTLYARWSKEYVKKDSK
jgi:mono/diheme cytochrome c family protein